MDEVYRADQPKSVTRPRELIDGQSLRNVCLLNFEELDSYNSLYTGTDAM